MRVRKLGVRNICGCSCVEVLTQTLQARQGSTALKDTGCSGHSGASRAAIGPNKPDSPHNSSIEGKASNNISVHKEFLRKGR